METNDQGVCTGCDTESSHLNQGDQLGYGATAVGLGFKSDRSDDDIKQRWLCTKSLTLRVTSPSSIYLKTFLHLQT
jgi:hypothetical protein